MANKLPTRGKPAKPISALLRQTLRACSVTSVVSDALRLYGPAPLSTNTGVGCYSLSSGESSWSRDQTCACVSCISRQNLYSLSHLGSPRQTLESHYNAEDTSLHLPWLIHLSTATVLAFECTSLWLVGSDVIVYKQLHHIVHTGSCQAGVSLMSTLRSSALRACV